MLDAMLTGHKQRVAAVDNLAAPGYDRPAVRFFRLAAEWLVQFTGVQRGQHLLDVGTGTGPAAIPAARAAGPEGRVVGVDLAEEMLAQAEANIRQARLPNGMLRVGDAEALHCAEVASRANARGLWLDAATLCVRGCKP